MNEDWMIRPKEGLGPLKFGMSGAEVTELGLGIYGEIENAGSLGNVSNDEVYQILLETMGEEAANEAMAELDAAQVEFKPSRRVNFASGVMADFVEDRLDSLMCHGAATQLHYNEKAIFKVDPVPALQDLQRLNGAPPLVNGADQKTIGWRATPRNVGEDFGNHQTVDLLP